MRALKLYFSLNDEKKNRSYVVSVLLVSNANGTGIVSSEYRYGCYIFERIEL